MSVYSEEEENPGRYAETVSDVDPDEFNNRFHETVSDDNSTAAESNSRKKKSTNLKIEDSGFHTVNRYVNRKRVTIGFYETSSTPDMYIRDAITGNRLPYKTGTSDEDLFFSVRFATGETNSRDGSNLFYDNPEQYERHFNTTVKNGIKAAWLNKVTYARRDQQTRIQQSEKAKQRTTLVR